MSRHYSEPDPGPTLGAFLWAVAAMLFTAFVLWAAEHAARLIWRLM